MKLDNINIEKKIYKIYFDMKCKISLYCEELKKIWHLNPKIKYDPYLPSINSYTRGIYIFWLKHNEKYYPLDIGKGILYNRISEKLGKLFYIPDLYVSFKEIDKDKSLELEEKNYIEKLNPICNKQYNNTLSKKYYENLKIYQDYMDIQENLRKKNLEKYKKERALLEKEIKENEEPIT